MSNTDTGIDFVIIWVDGSDLSWKDEKRKYRAIHTDGIIDDSEARYKDWDTLRYWFRGVEVFAPWVHKVFFITCGQSPSWLNVNAEKLVFLNHSDYIPKEYLPTFNSHTIEINLHRIHELSDQFVYFNDDMFLLKPVKPTMFFKHNQPVHPARLHGILPRNDGGIMPHIYINMIETINKHFDFHQCIKKNMKKWLNPFVIGMSDALENIFDLHYEQFPGIGNEHLPVPLLKQTLIDVWNCEYDLLHKTSTHRFRSNQDVSQYLFRYWQLASGKFSPIRRKRIGKRLTIQSENKLMLEIIQNQKQPMICINDMGKTSDREFERIKNELKRAFDRVLPEKSSFEL